MARMGLVVFPLALVFLIQPMAVLSSVEEREEKPFEPEFHDALIKAEIVKVIESSPEIQSWLAEVFRGYRSIAGDGAVDAKVVASTLAGIDADSIKKLCKYVKEALESANLKTNVSLSREDEEKAIEFGTFLPVISMVNAGMIKPEEVQKLESSPEIKLWFARFDQEYKSIAGGATVSVEGPASVHLDSDEIKEMEEQMEAFHIGGISSHVETSPIQEEEFIETGFPHRLMSMVDAGLMEEKN